MEKKVWISALVFSLALFFSPAAPASQKKDLLIASGGVGGMFFIIASAFSESITAQLPGLKITTVPGGGHANPLRIQAGEADLGITFFVNAKCAADGLDPYNKRLDKVKAIANLNIPFPFTFLVVKELGIKTFPDIKNKKPAMVLCPGTRGLGGEFTTRRALAEYGVTYEDLMKWKGKIHFSGWTEANNLIGDGHAHALATTTSIGSSHLIELVRYRDMVFLPLDENVRENMVKKFGYIKWVLKAGTYKGLDQDLPTIADGTVLIVRADLPEDLAYQITRIICENKAKYEKVHAMFKTFEPKLAARSTQVPLHPGAARYYKEAGYLR